MGQLYLVPQWFFGFDIAFELLFAAVTLVIALYSFRVYQLSAQRECKLFGSSFLAISLAYIIWAGLNVFLTSRSDAGHALSLLQITFLGSIGVYSHVILMIIGFATLAYTTLNVRSQRTFSLIATLSLLIVIFSAQKALAFYFVSSFLLFFTLLAYGRAYFKRGTFTQLLTFSGFVFLFFGHVDFIFASIHGVHYVIGHVLQLIGYALLAGAFLVILKK